MTPTTPPLAQLVSVDGHTAKVRCPYCGSVHVHNVRTTELGQTEHRAPACGLTRSAADRATGYQFTTTKESS